jgi:carboxymethylenebutenolidase
MSYWTSTIRVDGADVNAHVSAPAGPARGGGVLLHGGYGPDAGTVELAERLAQSGFAIVTPDLYHRLTPPFADDPMVQIRQLTWTGARDDIAASIDYLRREAGVDGSIAILGFCMGGALALIAAADSDVSAAVLYYPHDVLVPFGASGPVPIDRAQAIRIPVLGHFGAEDPNPGPDHAARLEAELTAGGVEHELHTYAECGHGFSGVKRRKPVAANLAFDRTLDWFERYLRAAVAT